MTEDTIKFEGQVYVRKLKAQELGYRSGSPHGGGRYFYISKSSTPYFPPLSDTITNDHLLLNIIPSFNDDIVLTKYVYHNDKFTVDGGTRDEYRLYLNSKLDPRGELFKPDDIVLIVKLFSEDDLMYKLIRLTSSSRDYIKIKSILNTYDSRNESHALISISKLTFVEQLRKIKIGERVIPKEIIEESFNEPIHTNQPLYAEQHGTTIIRSRSFRDLVLYFYNYRCAITGNKILINYKDFNNLEAAHIWAHSAGGGSNPSNGIAMERNLHWAFDKGFFTINFVNGNYHLQVHEKALSIPYLAEKNAMKITIHEDSRSRPNLESLAWHKRNVFGLFLKVEV